MRTSFRKYFTMALCLCGLAMLAACQPKVVASPPLPNLRIAVAPFNQPVQTTELLAGFLPSEQGRVSQENFLELNALFEQKLAGTGRNYHFIGQDAVPTALDEDVRGRRSALATWVRRGKEAGAELLVVPQIVDWRPRVGGTAGVVTPASINMDFYLIDCRMEGSLIQRSHFAVTQEALMDNLLTLGEFMQRKGRWVTAVELAGEAMDKGIKEFGL